MSSMNFFTSGEVRSSASFLTRGSFSLPFLTARTLLYGLSSDFSRRMASLRGSSPASRAKLLLMAAASTSLRERGSWAGSSSLMVMFLGFFAMSEGLASAPAPFFSSMSPSSARRLRARPSLVTSLGTATVAPFRRSAMSLTFSE
ncbi:hypothetical protein SF12_09230 [Streptomyces sp. MBRL 601]|nr:hypothetical protein SF12_09230 [Streptomyces sp. MBRL 601]